MQFREYIAKRFGIPETIEDSSLRAKPEELREPGTTGVCSSAYTLPHPGETGTAPHNDKISGGVLPATQSGTEI